MYPPNPHQQQAATPPPLPSQQQAPPRLPSQPPPLPQQTASPNPQTPSLMRHLKRVSPLVWGLGIFALVVLILAGITLRNEGVRQADFTHVNTAIEAQRDALNEAKRLKTLSEASSLYRAQYLAAAIEKQQEAVSAIETINPRFPEAKLLLSETLRVETYTLSMWQDEMNAYNDALRGEPVQ